MLVVCSCSREVVELVVHVDLHHQLLVHVHVVLHCVLRLVLAELSDLVVAICEVDVARSNLYWNIAGVA